MDKVKLRTEIKERIAALDRTYIIESDNAIFNNIISMREFISAPRVFTYISIDREADTRRLIEHCRNIGKQVALPANLNGGKMDFALLECALNELPLGLLGIPTPKDNAKKLIPEAGDIIIVPALCYDEEFYRLGHGGGYFDRYLSDCKAFTIGICREKLMVSEVPREFHDMRVNCLVTEKRIARPE